jgi:hypothetical protein
MCQSATSSPKPALNHACVDQTVVPTSSVEEDLDSTTQVKHIVPCTRRWRSRLWCWCRCRHGLRRCWSKERFGKQPIKSSAPLVRQLGVLAAALALTVWMDELSVGLWSVTSISGAVLVLIRGCQARPEKVYAREVTSHQ